MGREKIVVFKFCSVCENFKVIFGSAGLSNAKGLFSALLFRIVFSE